MKKLLKKLLRDRRGISMTEVVVAMALVVIVTGAAISVLIASIQFDAKYKAQTHAQNACESAVECIRFADGKEKLHELLSQKVGFVQLKEDKEEGNDITYFFDAGKASAEVVITYVDGSEGNYIAKYVVRLNDEEIYDRIVTEQQ